MVNPSRNTLADCVRRGDGGDDACLVWRRFADHMMTLERGCLGWQPSTALEAWWRAGLVWCLFRSGELVGYVAARTGRTVCRVWQIAVRRDARRIEHGLMLLAAVEGAARAEGAHEISLWCAADIEAVAFWECVGANWSMTVCGESGTPPLPAPAFVRTTLIGSKRRPFRSSIPTLNSDPPSRASSKARAAWADISSSAYTLRLCTIGR
jgi:ribosomal protein S18 acetylase RimI-like enzyme